MIDKFKETFREEAIELLNNLESSLLELEDDPSNQEEIAAVFRTMHTIKGSSAMFGFQHISTFTHEIENLMEYLREGKITATKEFINLTLEARDHIRTLLDREEPVEAGQASVSESLLKRFHELVDGLINRERPTEGDAKTREPIPLEAGEVPALSSDGEKQDSSRLDHQVIYRIRFRPSPGICANGTNVLLLFGELAEMGDYSAIAYVEEVPELSRLSSEEIRMYWDIILTTKEDKNQIRDVFIFVEDSAKIDISVIDDLSDIEEEHHKRLGEILLERGVIDPKSLDEAIKSQKRIGEVLEDKGVDHGEVLAALEEQEHVRKSRQKLQGELSSGSVRVGSDKLDSLVDLVGELVTLQARLSQTSMNIGDGQLSSITENLERLISELRDSTMSMRMLPIGTTFSKFRRLVRDLAGDLGKEADLITQGGETELDKTVIEKLNDPLVHLIRNCIDHGIERPQVRDKAGKPKKGSIRLSASHSGASVLISVEDDGGGLNREKILRKAMERGIVQKASDLTDSEVFQLIFAPGLSTAENVTKVSGRGVGMDVVKKEIDSLGGNISVESIEGSFTRITLKIPLTLAIIEGLLVEIGKENFVFPLSSVEECIELASEDRSRHKNGRIINNRGEILPYIRLREVFAVPGDLPEIEQIVVVGALNGKVGFVVDNVIGDYQTVIKNLGRMYRGVEGISGATILGNGSVALILDILKLTTLAARGAESGVKGLA